MGVLRSGPSNAASLFEDVFYFFDRPQELYGPNAPLPPPPAAPDKELAEQTLGVFDMVVYNETGSGNDGDIVVTTS